MRAARQKLFHYDRKKNYIEKNLIEKINTKELCNGEYCCILVVVSSDGSLRSNYAQSGS
jgi:hypothetical protein